MAQWLSWLERRPVTAEVESSSLFWVVLRDLSSVGRASALQAEGHRFEPYRSQLYADVAQLAEQLICNQQVIGSSPIIGFMDGFPSGQRGQTVNLLAPPSKVRILLHPFGIDTIQNFISRGGAVWKLVGLITRRPQVQILPPQLLKKPFAIPEFWDGCPRRWQRSFFAVF